MKYGELLAALLEPIIRSRQQGDKMTTNHTTDELDLVDELLALASLPDDGVVCIRAANELTRLRADIAELRAERDALWDDRARLMAEREAMAKQEPVGVTYAKYVCGEEDTVAIRWLIGVDDRPPPGTHLFLSPLVPDQSVGKVTDCDTPEQEPTGAGMVLRMVRNELGLQDGENVIEAVRGLLASTRGRPACEGL